MVHVMIAGIIASKRCNNVEIYGNTVYDGGEDAVGIFLHRSSNFAKVYGEPSVACGASYILYAALEMG